jgi:hypothetical protein
VADVSGEMAALLAVAEEFPDQDINENIIPVSTHILDIDADLVSVLSLSSQKSPPLKSKTQNSHKSKSKFPSSQSLVSLGNGSLSVGNGSAGTEDEATLCSALTRAALRYGLCIISIIGNIIRILLVY